MFSAPKKLLLWIQETVHAVTINNNNNNTSNNKFGNFLERVANRLSLQKLTRYHLHVKIDGSQLFQPIMEEFSINNKSGHLLKFKVQRFGHFSESCFWSVFPQEGQIEKDKSAKLELRCVGLNLGSDQDLIVLETFDSVNQQVEYFYIPVKVVISGGMANKTFWEIPSQDLKQGKLIGSGASGEVHLSTVWGVPIVSKSWEYGRSDQIPQDFLRELRVFEELRHPNLLSFIGAITTMPCKSVLVTEYCGLGSLDKLLKETENLSWIQKIRIAIDSCKGMEFLHNRGKIHRDLKSPNILITHDYRAKISDFGESRELGEEMMTMMVGTFYWMVNFFKKIFINFH